MLWVDHASYYGPDRRKARGLRIHDRRRVNLAALAPSVETALRQLRLYVLEAVGAEALLRFADRARAVSALADHHHEAEACGILDSLAGTLMRHLNADMRAYIDGELDHLSGAMHAYH